MGNIEELEKYKKLLDDGALSEDEFRILKQKLLGLKTDEEKELERQQERERALAEIAQMKAEQAAIQTEEEMAVQEQNTEEQADGLNHEAQRNQCRPDRNEKVNINKHMKLKKQKSKHV